MADLQAQRTLVKSPPELWAELSNPISLGRRLSDFGEIRITRLIPEKTVAWEGDRASGTVELESSGWGTKVRLTAVARRDPPSPRAPATTAAHRITAVIVGDEDDGPESGPEDTAQAAEVPSETGRRPSPPVRVTGRPSAAERSAARMARRTAAAAAAAAPPPTPGPPIPAPASAEAEVPKPPADSTAPKRPGFFARLFGRRTAARAAAAARSSPPAVLGTPPPGSRPPTPPEPPPASRDPARPSGPEATTGVVERPAPERPEAENALDPGRAAPADPPPPVAENLGPKEGRVGRRYAQRMERPTALDPEQTMAVLSSVLDDLGAAHHRPFSRE